MKKINSVSVCFERQIININKKVIFWKKTTHPMLRANHSKPAEIFIESAHFWLPFSIYTWELNFTKRKILMVFTSLFVFSKFTSSIGTEKNHIFTAFQNFFQFPFENLNFKSMFLWIFMEMPTWTSIEWLKLVVT